MSQPNAGISGIDSQATVTGLFVGHELSVGEILAARFRIDALLGIGGMGVVYRARDLSLDIDVAIKLLRPELARKPEAFERFRNELLLARQVSSPHVVRIHDIAQHGERWLISMDFIAGDSLERRLEQRGRLNQEQAVTLMRGLLRGLAAAHERGVIHRDLKPANILLDDEDRAVITDFGVARSLGATGMTQSGLIIGTPEYLSPEQARGEAVDGRSDLYTAGLILYESLAGSLPFAGGTPAETVMRRLVRPPPSLAQTRPELPSWLHAFAERLLKLNPAHRFRTAAEALQALDTQRVPRPPWHRRRLLLSLLALVAALGMADLLRQHWPSLPAAAVAPALSTPRLAILPLSVAADDAPAADLARGVEEYLRQWWRADAMRVVIPRERVLAAVARVAPDSRDDALRRRLPDIARAAGADQLLQGSLVHDATGWTLQWTPERLGSAPLSALTVRAQGADAPALLADLRRVLAPISPPSPPLLAAAELVAVGSGLRALDEHKPALAVDALAAVPADSASALVLQVRLQAQLAAQQEVSAQATRQRIPTALAADASPLGLSLLADALLQERDATAGLRALEQALARYPHDPELRVQLAQAKAAHGFGERAMQLLQAQVDADAQDARAWFLLGRTAIQQGQAQAAVDDYLVRALVLWTRAGDVRAEAEARNALGVGYERLGQLDAAVEQYTRAAAMREKVADPRGMATSLRNLAVVQAVRGERALAEATLERARVTLEALGDRASIADLHNDRGVIAEERGDLRAALAAYREALALRQQLDNPTLLAQSLNNVAFCYFQVSIPRQSRGL